MYSKQKTKKERKKERKKQKLVIYYIGRLNAPIQMVGNCVDKYQM
jgi:hypothetical protein